MCKHLHFKLLGAVVGAAGAGGVVVVVGVVVVGSLTGAEVEGWTGADVGADDELRLMVATMAFINGLIP